MKIEIIEFFLFEFQPEHIVQDSGLSIAHAITLELKMSNSSFFLSSVFLSPPVGWSVVNGFSGSPDLGADVTGVTG